MKKDDQVKQDDQVKEEDVQVSPEAEAAEETTETGADAESAAEPETGEEAETDAKTKDELASQVASLEEEIKTLKDQHLRLQAEYENFRRRSKEEKNQLYDKSCSDVITAWFPVLDNLERARDTISELEGEQKDAIAEGLDLVSRQARQILEQYDVEEIPALGETFDPELHAAVLHVEDDSVGENEIVEVFETGYKRRDRVLRHSVVKVAN